MIIDNLKKTIVLLMGIFIKPSIILESKPLFSDNTKAVFDELVRRGYERKYNLVWYIKWNQCATLKNGLVQYWNPRDRKTIVQKIINYSFYYKKKCFICCNQFLYSEDNTVQSANKKSRFHSFLPMELL